ncbi:MAG: hypothetical protein JRI23_28330, partial [Deltaproteobacteria bacterium]|nr:hypothetical protein [Deltaproteobacteria bacterium]MBW2536006.1 hypothetical protein [Deltaproteobacteria bacterium]
MPRRIGLLVGEDEPLVDALRERCGGHPDVTCELALIDVTGERHISRYDVLVDRVSPWVPQYGAYLRASMLAGVTVINEPAAVAAGDGFFGVSLAAHLGMAVPRTVLLPQHSYDSAIDPNRWLRNLQYPVSWQTMVDYVRLPCVLRSASQPERLAPVLVRDLQQLWAAFDRTGRNVTMLQQHFAEATYVRAVCVGGEHVVLRGIDGEPAPLDEPHHQLRGSVSFAATGLGSGVGERLGADAAALCRGAGYDLASVDFAVCDGVGYPLSAPEPLPAVDPAALSAEGFAEIVDRLAALV